MNPNGTPDFSAKSPIRCWGCRGPTWEVAKQTFWLRLVRRHAWRCLNASCKRVSLLTLRQEESWRKNANQLLPPETDAFDVFEAASAVVPDARAWMLTAHPGLDGQRPMDVATTPDQAERVMALLPPRTTKPRKRTAKGP